MPRARARCWAARPERPGRCGSAALTEAADRADLHRGAAPPVTGRVPPPGQSRVTDFVSFGGVTTGPVTRTPEPPDSLIG